MTSPCPNAKVSIFLLGVSTITFHGELTFWRATPFSLLAVAAACAVCLRPQAGAPLLCLCAALIAELGWAMPRVNTNQILCLLVAATVLGSMLIGWATVRGWEPFALPALRWILVAVYLCSGWHKLNRDFFDPRFSSAVFLCREFADSLHHQMGIPLFPSSAAGEMATIYVTVLIELGCPVLLIIGRLRPLGICLLSVLHGVFGTVFFYGFSTTMIALLALFVPPACLLRLDPGAGARRGLAALLVLAAVVGIAVGCGFHRPTHGLFRLFWLVTEAASVLWICWRRPWRERSGGLSEPVLRLSPAMWAFPVAALFNGICPYLGLKTEGSFAMYSNLRTEGGKSNHFMIRHPWRGFGYLEDLVIVDGSSDPEMENWARIGHQLPWIELALRVDELRTQAKAPITLAYSRHGVRTALPDAVNAAAFSRRPSWWQRKFLSFRDILPEGANGFSH